MSLTLLHARDAGVVHHDAQRAEPLGRRVDGGAHDLLDRDVAVDEHSHVAAAHQGVAQLLAGLVLDVRDADLSAMLPEVANDGFTDIPMAPLLTRATFPSNLSFDRKERG